MTDADEFLGARMIIFETSVSTAKISFKIDKRSEVCQALDLDVMMVTPDFYEISGTRKVVGVIKKGE